MTQQTDQIRRFIFEGSNVRGVHVHLGDAWQSIRERNQHAWPVNTLLGEALAASTLLASTIKIDGSLTIQTSGSGPVKMLVVQATGARTVRGMVSVRGEISSDSFGELLGQGHLAITIDPGTGGERYQGIVTLEGEDLAEVLANYFVNSEQLPTQLWLAADEHHASGLLLQQLPADDPDEEPDDTAWQHVTTLADTVKPEELTALDAEQLLRRLFVADEVRIFQSNDVRFYCRCSRSRVSGMLQAMPEHELLETAEDEGGQLTVSCDFCNETYVFDAEQIRALYVDEAPST